VGGACVDGEGGGGVDVIAVDQWAEEGKEGGVKDLDCLGLWKLLRGQW